MSKTYMVAVKKKVVVDVILYHEVVASSQAESVEIAKREIAEKPITDKYWLDEAIFSLKNDVNLKTIPVKIESCGRSNQFHSKEQCKLCKKHDSEE